MVEKQYLHSDSNMEAIKYFNAQDIVMLCHNIKSQTKAERERTDKWYAVIQLVMKANNSVKDGGSAKQTKTDKCNKSYVFIRTYITWKVTWQFLLACI